MDENQPAFGYPLLSFKETDDFPFDASFPEIPQLSPSKQPKDHPISLKTKSWSVIKQRLEPLREQSRRAKRTDDAFEIIMKSFTYGKRLMRMRMSKARRL